MDLATRVNPRSSRPIMAKQSLIIGQFQWVVTISKLVKAKLVKSIEFSLIPELLNHPLLTVIKPHLFVSKTVKQ